MLSWLATSLAFMPAHAVADREQGALGPEPVGLHLGLAGALLPGEVRDEEVVLVVIALLAVVRGGPELDL